MSDDLHSCSYYCERPACVIRQRDWLRDQFIVPGRCAENRAENPPVSPRAGVLPPLPMCPACHIETRLEYKIIPGGGRPKLDMWFVCPSCQSITRNNQ